ncbi:SDR family oxidoreductase [Jiangella aurantiaca]|uniref:SDR family oxidoreductase n=1 Tax=Jiangella aurantiaca TaxID=2530373 RepID=A0A4R5AC76_9ACTN|nr:SDR family NAD(P)-dependent oxidoreductase [Jiangella aurantiaca]TDD69831.1 SDR family oxidoreductase [Jiangella aurantiaca]
MMPGRFAGQVVLVTGAGRNIGRAIAERFAAEGASVAVNALTAEDAAPAVAALRTAGARAAAYVADVSDATAVAAMITAIGTDFGRLDVLVNNAAVPTVGRVPLLDLSLSDWDRAFAVNVRGTFLCTVAAAKLMLQEGGGAIVNVSSIGATRAHRNAVAYDATKGAVEAATRAMAVDLAPHGIRVNAVAPGSIANDRLRAAGPEEARARAAAVPLGRVGAGAEVAAAVAFLASADAAYITGEVVAVDGGLAAQARPSQDEPRFQPASA